MLFPRNLREFVSNSERLYPEYRFMRREMLPSIPNVVGLIRCGCLWLKYWTVHWVVAGDPPVWPGFLTLPPDQLLPALSQLEHTESRKREEYWISFLLLGPLAMCLLCELIRVVALLSAMCCAKVRGWKDASHASSGEFKLLLPARSTPDAESQMSSALQAPELEHHRMCRIWCCTIGISFYHVACISVVCVAVANDWMTMSSGLAWELWALWQHTCLWTLFCQNLVRCCGAETDALRVSTADKVLLYTMPLVSELFDTMKDWTMTGICLLAPSSRMGFLWGALIVAGDLCLTMLCPQEWKPCKIDSDLRICPPLLLMMVVVVVFVSLVVLLSFGLFAVVLAGVAVALVLFIGAAVQQVYLVCIGGSSVLDVLDTCYTNPDSFQAYFVKCGIIVFFVAGIFWLCEEALLNNWHDSLSFSQEVMSSFFIVLERGLAIFADGSYLCVASTYVIASSYVMVLRDPDAAADVRKTYSGILALPAKSLNSGATSSRQKLEIKMSNLVADFLSRGRLLISWAEDWPQGFVGVWVGILIESNFAYVSAAFSLVKGLLIPSGQTCMLAIKRSQAEESWNKFFSDPAMLREVSEALGLEDSEYDHVPDRLPNLLQLHDERLAALNIHRERRLYEDIFNEQRQWAQDAVDAKHYEKVLAAYTRDQLKFGDPSRVQPGRPLGHVILSLILGLRWSNLGIFFYRVRAILGRCCKVCGRRSIRCTSSSKPELLGRSARRRASSFQSLRKTSCKISWMTALPSETSKHGVRAKQLALRLKT